MKRLSIATAAALTVSLLLASCASAGYQCRDPLGCQVVSSDSPLVIGAILATAGPDGAAGTKALQMVEKAVADKDVLFGHAVKLYHYGTDCTPDSARTAATEFATYSELTAVIGSSCAGDAALAGPILSDAGIPLFGPVPDPSAAYAMAEQVFAAIEQVTVQMPDGTLYIPRQALFDSLQVNR